MSRARTSRRGFKKNKGARDFVGEYLPGLQGNPNAFHSHDDPFETVRPKSAEVRLHAAMINNAIDESLRTKDLYYLGITQETIKDAREFIMSEHFIYIHKFAFGVKPQGLVPLLKRLWDRNDPEELERVRKAFQRENIAEERRDKSSRITEKRGFVPNVWHGTIKRDSSGRFVND